METQTQTDCYECLKLIATPEEGDRCAICGHKICWRCSIMTDGDAVVCHQCAIDYADNWIGVLRNVAPESLPESLRGTNRPAPVVRGEYPLLSALGLGMAWVAAKIKKVAISFRGGLARVHLARRRSAAP